MGGGLFRYPPDVSAAQAWRGDHRDETLTQPCQLRLIAPALRLQHGAPDGDRRRASRTKQCQSSHNGSPAADHVIDQHDPPAFQQGQHPWIEI